MNEREEEIQKRKVSYRDLTQNEKKNHIQEILSNISSKYSKNDIQMILSDLQKIFTIPKKIEISKLSSTSPKREISFSMIPPHVVVDHILVFFSLSRFNVSVSRNFCKKFFGYFKNDKTRNIWFVFRTLEVENFIKFNKSMFKRKKKAFSLIKIGNITRLNTVSSGLSDVKGENFYSLVSLNIGLSISKQNNESNILCDQMFDIFCSSNKFEKLSSLILHINPSRAFRDQSGNKKMFLQLPGILSSLSLKKFEVYLAQLSYVQYSDFSFALSYLGHKKHFNLEYLNLYRVDVCNIEDWKNVEDVKSLKLFSVKNFDEKVFTLQQKMISNLHHFTLFARRSDRKCTLSRRFNFDKLTSIFLFHVDLQDSFFQANRFNSLKEMNIDDSVDIFGKGWKAIPLLEKFRVVGCANFKGSTNFINNLNNLKRLFLFQCPNVNDDFFSKTEKLEKLSVVQCSSLTGKGWSSLENLKILHLEKNLLFGDVIFQDMEMDKLTELKIVRCRNIKGNKWNEMKALALFKIKNCKLDDHLFQTLKFPKLKSLKIFRVNTLEGIGWKIEKKLKQSFKASMKYLDIEKALQETSFLKKRIERFSKILEKNLIRFEIVGCAMLDDFSFMNPERSNNFGNSKRLIIFASYNKLVERMINLKESLEAFKRWLFQYQK